MRSLLTRLSMNRSRLRLAPPHHDHWNIRHKRLDEPGEAPRRERRDGVSIDGDDHVAFGKTELLDAAPGYRSFARRSRTRRTTLTVPRDETDSRTDARRSTTSELVLATTSHETRPVNPSGVLADSE